MDRPSKFGKVSTEKLLAPDAGSVLAKGWLWHRCILGTVSGFSGMPYATILQLGTTRRDKAIGKKDGTTAR